MPSILRGFFYAQFNRHLSYLRTPSRHRPGRSVRQRRDGERR